MPERDADGYILLSECNSENSLLPQPQSPPTRCALLQLHLASFYGTLISCVEGLFTRQVLHSANKYLLYPLLSGAFSATIAHWRRR